MNEKIPDGIWSVMITPFDSQKNVDYGVIDEIVDFYTKSGLAGIFATCLTSEVADLSFDEIVEIVSRTVAASRERIGVVAGGIVFDSLEKQAQLINRVYDAGASAVVFTASQLACKGYDDDAFKKSVSAIMDMTGDIPLGMYECPYPYHRILSPELYSWIAGTGRFVFHKDTSCNIDSIAEKIERTQNSGLKFFNANCATLLDSLKLGGNGYCGVGTNYYPELFAWLYENNNTAEPDMVESVFDFLKKSERYFDLCNAYPATAKQTLAYRGINIGSTCRIKTGTLDAAAKDELNELVDKIEGINKQISLCGCCV